MNKNLIVLVGINKAYKIYIPYYVLCLYYTNHESDILIITDDSHITNWKETYDYVACLYGKDKIKLHINPEYFANIPIHKDSRIKVIYCARALLPTKYYKDYDYVYFGDIDLLITQKNLFNLHIKQCAKNELCVDNVVRTAPEHHRVTGLHFICVKDYIQKYGDKNDNFNWDLFLSHINNIKPSKYIFDEHIWHYMLDNNDITKLITCNYRPTHGIHLGAFRTLLKKNTFNKSEIEYYYNEIVCKVPNAHHTRNEYRKDIKDFIYKKDFLFIHCNLKEPTINLLYDII
jgi:hypothetical protein